MADSISIDIAGGTELHDRFLTMPDRVSINVNAGACYAGIKVIRDIARKLVPILDLSKWGGPHEPGALLAGIFIGRTRSHDRNIVGAICGIGREVGWWGKLVEFGTRHARAYPFMRPAADEGKEAAVEAFVEYASKRIEIEAQKAA
jgi:HK97 gp10 family phage protein